MTDDEVLERLDFKIRCKICRMFAATVALQGQCARCAQGTEVIFVCQRDADRHTEARHPRCLHCESHGYPGIITFAVVPITGTVEE